MKLTIPFPTVFFTLGVALVAIVLHYRIERERQDQSNALQQFLLTNSATIIVPGGMPEKGSGKTLSGDRVDAGGTKSGVLAGSGCNKLQCAGKGQGFGTQELRNGFERVVAR